MKLAVITDLHIAIGQRWDETQRILSWCADTLRERSPDAVLIGGDLFDARSKPEERTWAADFLLSLAEVAPVVGCAGNHDAPHDLAIFNRCHGKHPISFHETPAVHVLGSVAVAVLPWDRSAPSLDMLRMTGPERREAETAARRAMLTKLGDDLDATGAATKLLLGHVELREAMPAIGQPEKRGPAFQMTLDDLALVRAHGYALGHVHAAQSWQINGAPCFYPGSVTRRAFGEREEKHVAFLDVDGPRVAVELVRTPATPLLLADAAWEERDPGVWGWSVDVDALVADAAGADVRFTYAVDDERRAAAALAAEEVMARLAAAGAKLTKPEEKVRPRGKARAPEIARASSLEEKLAITLTQKGHGPESAQHGRVIQLFRDMMGAAR